MIGEEGHAVPDEQELPPEVVMWRCRECGKFSHAKRRPSVHQRVRVLEANADYRRSVMVWCGPFDRYVAQPRDQHPPAPFHPDFEREVYETEQEWFSDPNAGIVF